MLRYSTLILLAALVVLAAGDGVIAQNPTRQYVILAHSQGPGSAQLDDLLTAAGGTLVSRSEDIGMVVAESSNPNFLSLVRADGRVQQAAEDLKVQWIPSPSTEALAEQPGTEDTINNPEPRYALQWAHRHIRADVANDAGHLGSEVKRARVAVIDTGVYATHIDLAANLNVALSKSFVPSEPGFEFVPPAPGAFSHGTHVSGIIAAPINGVGIQGVAPEAEIVNVKVLQSNTGSGAFSWVINGILYAAGPTVDADIINMSLGATFSRTNQGGDGLGPLVSALNRAVNFATRAGTFVVSSAGNEGVNLNSNVWSIPAQSGNGVAVSALGPVGLFTPNPISGPDRLASYSNYGQSVINVGAPGGDFVYPGNENCTVGGVTRPCWVFDMVFSPGAVVGSTNFFFWAAGTSMAAPHVSGVAALIVGKYGTTSPAQIKAAIQNGAVDILKPGADPATGKGRLDAVGALQ
jgi:subtilisin family serine protease